MSLAMVRALVRKELRQLMPLIAAFAGLLLIDFISEFILKPPDELGWAARSWLTDPAGAPSAAWASLVLGVVTAFNLLPTEHEQRTIDFLYTLPVRRWQLFAVKAGVGIGLLIATNLISTALEVGQASLNPDSIERRQLVPNLVLLQVLLDCAFAAISVCYGVLLSYFRRFGWLLLVLIIFVVKIAGRLVPPLEALSVDKLFSVEHHGTRPLVSWGTWGLHGALAVLSLALAARLWLGDNERFAAFYERLRNRPGLRRAGTVLVVALGALISLAVMIPSRPAPPEAGAPAAGLRRITTDHFIFSYRPADEAAARQLSGQADTAYDRIQRWLGAPPSDRVMVDLTAAGSDHAGLAGWRTIRIDVNTRGISLEHVLYHETVHVLARGLSEGAPAERLAGEHVFAEGLAEYVTFELLGEPGDRAEARRIASLAHQRFHLRFEDLLSPAAFLARHDEYLFYAMGEVWVAALVDACGSGTPAAVLRRFASRDIPQQIAGPALWRQVLQAGGCDLEAAIGRFESRLRGLEDEAATLPVASARFLEEQAGQLIFTVEVHAPTRGPWPVRLLVRDDPDAPPDQIRHAVAEVEVGKPQRVSIAAPPQVGQRFEFQVGARTGPGGRVFSSRWQSTSRRP